MATVAQANSYTGTRQYVSLGLLIVANLLPLLGVLYLDWDVAALMILYWSENLVVGFYTLAKMLITSPLGGILSGLFFCIHYGGFCAVHGLFILTLLVNPDTEFMSGDPWPLWLVFIQLLVSVIQQVLAFAPPDWIVAFSALWISHGASFITNFLLGGERYESNAKALMVAPYGRIVLLHITVIFGGMAVLTLGQPLGMLLVLVFLKLTMDVGLHLRVHRRRASGVIEKS